MVICNIITDKETLLNSEILEKYKDRGPVYMSHTMDDIDNSLPTMFYGYSFAKDFHKMDKLNRDHSIKENVFWSYNEYELKSKCWVDHFVEMSANKFFQHEDRGIDLIFDKFNYHTELIGGINAAIYKSWPIIHSGKYEIYIAKLTDSRPIVYSFKKDMLKYMDKEPASFFYSIINNLYGKCWVFSTDEVSFFRMHYKPVFFQDAHQAEFGGDPITIQSIQEEFSTIRNLSKPDVLIWILKHKFFNSKKFIMGIDK